MLLASYNGSRWIGEQIKSILGQNSVDVRTIISDDGSSDETLQEVARFQDSGRIRLLAPSSPTRSAAQNFLRLIRSAPAGDCDFVALADQDDVWDAAKLSRACRVLTGSSSVGYSSATLAVWPDGRQFVLRQSTARRAADYLFEGAGQGCTFVLRADFYERVRRFAVSHIQLTRELHYHDWMIYALARSWGHCWTFDPLPSVRYRQHAGNDTGARAGLRGIIKRITLIRTGWYRTQLAAILAVCVAAAPENPVVNSWRSVFESRNGLLRRVRISYYILTAGRRKRLDNVLIAIAALAGLV